MQLKLGGLQLNVCAVVTLQKMGEIDVTGERYPACAQNYEEFLERLRAAVDKYNNEHSGSCPRDPIGRVISYQASDRVNGDHHFIRKNHKLVQCYLINGQEKAREYLREFGFQEIGPFKADKSKTAYKADLYLYTMEASEFNDKFYPVRGRKKVEVKESAEERQAA